MMKKLFTRLSAMFLLLAMLCVVSPSSAFATTTRYNVSYSPVTCNASAGSLPTGVSTVYTGDKIYFNFQVDKSQKIKSVTLYYKTPGSSKYKTKTSTATNYLRYTDFSYTVGSSTGTLKYYFKVKNTSGKTTTTSTKSVTVKKATTTKTTTTRTISTNYTNSSLSTTTSKTSSSYYVTVTGTKSTSGTKLYAGNTFYTYYKIGSTYYKSTAYKVTKSGKTYYATYVKVGSSYVDVAASQCLGFAHYIQYLLYGKYDGTTTTLKSGFTEIATGKTNSSSNAKTYITKAGAKAHIRVYDSKYGCDHSLIVVSVSSKGFYYVDANGTSEDNEIRIGYWTWADFASRYSKIRYIRYYTG